MILYLAPGACSLADHIALNEAGLPFEQVLVDLKRHTTEDGRDYTSVNPKGYVPALTLDGGEMLTENVAILSWIADQEPKLAPKGTLSRYRLLETLAYISTEVHKSFKPFFASGVDDKAKAGAGQAIIKRLTYLAERLKDDYLLGPEFSVADAYLFVMLMWSKKNGLSIPDQLSAYFDRVQARLTVRRTLQEEKLA